MVSTFVEGVEASLAVVAFGSRRTWFLTILADYMPASCKALWDQLKLKTLNATMHL